MKGTNHSNSRFDASVVHPPQRRQQFKEERPPDKKIGRLDDFIHKTHLHILTILEHN